jgi:hypothetical protein
MECGDQVLRNFLNALVIHLRGTKENPKPTDVLAKHKAQIPAKEGSKDRPEFKASQKDEEKLEVTNLRKTKAATKNCLKKIT